LAASHGPAKSYSKIKIEELGNILKSLFIKGQKVILTTPVVSNTICNAKEDICMLLCNKIQVLSVVTLLLS
jgi:hypothetical protein